MGYDYIGLLDAIDNEKDDTKLRLAFQAGGSSSILAHGFVEAALKDNRIDEERALHVTEVLQLYPQYEWLNFLD